MQNAIVYELSLRRTLRYSFQIVAFAEAPDFLAPATYLVTSPYLAARRKKKHGAFSIWISTLTSALVGILTTLKLLLGILTFLSIEIKNVSALGSVLNIISYVCCALRFWANFLKLQNVEVVQYQLKHRNNHRPAPPPPAPPQYDHGWESKEGVIRVRPNRQNDPFTPPTLFLMLILG